jgi:glycosyltransferase involved in cell wall biosynthesis
MPDPVVVALVVHTFDVGGMERFVCHLADRLDRRRWSPVIVCLSRNGTAAKWISRDDVPVVEVGGRGGFDFRAWKRFARILQNERVGLIQSHNWGTLVETEVARRWAGVPCHVHSERGTVMGGTNGKTGIRQWMRALSMRWTLNRCDATIAVAESVRERVDRITGFPASQIQVLPNGVDPPPCTEPAKSRAEIRARLGVDENALLIGSVGRLVTVKNFGSLVQAAAALIHEGRNVHLALVGDGPQEQALSQAIAASQCSQRIHLAGAQGNVGDWLSAFDIYVNCSLSEGMSQSVLEAMASGLPLVVTDAGDNRILAEGCGLVVPIDDAAELTAGLRKLCGAEGPRLQFGQAALERHRQYYSIETMIGRYDRLYTEVIARKKGKGRMTSDPVGPGELSGEEHGSDPRVTARSGCHERALRS